MDFFVASLTDIKHTYLLACLNFYIRPPFTVGDTTIPPNMNMKLFLYPSANRYGFKDVYTHLFFLPAFPRISL